MVKLFLIFGSVLFSLNSLAEVNVTTLVTLPERELAADITEDDIAGFAQNRSYPGGYDEDDIEVMDSIPAPRRYFPYSAIQRQVIRHLESDE